MNKHTPGPWKYLEASGCVEAAGNVQMMICAPPRPMHEDCPANEAFFTADAALIAAAPDLLAACERVLRQMEWTDQPQTMIQVDALKSIVRAAIAKARGEAVEQ